MERRFGERQEQILRAALAVFGRRGFHPAQMDEVAQTAGVGKGTLYHHFESKEALLRDAILYLTDLGERQQEARLAEVDDPIDRLYHEVLGDYQFIKAHRRMARVAFTEATGLGHSPAFRASILEMHRRRHEKLVEVMEEGQRARRLRTDVSADFLALMFRGMVREVILEMLFFEEDPRREPAEVAEGVMQVFLRGAKG